MNKKAFTEVDLRTKFIMPALVGPNGEKWNVMTQAMDSAGESSSGLPTRSCAAY
jgi:hypothetical protein